jgi:hypothetical protein
MHAAEETTRAGIKVSQSDFRGWRFELMGLENINLSISMAPEARVAAKFGQRGAKERLFGTCAERGEKLSSDRDAELLPGRSWTLAR